MPIQPPPGFSLAYAITAKAAHPRTGTEITLLEFLSEIARSAGWRDGLSLKLSLAEEKGIATLLDLAIRPNLNRLGLAPRDKDQIGAKLALAGITSPIMPEQRVTQLIKAGLPDHGTLRERILYAYRRIPAVTEEERRIISAEISGIEGLQGIKEAYDRGCEVRKLLQS